MFKLFNPRKFLLIRNGCHYRLKYELYFGKQPVLWLVDFVVNPLASLNPFHFLLFQNNFWKSRMHMYIFRNVF